MTIRELGEFREQDPEAYTFHAVSLSESNKRINAAYKK
jgi:hypothetical protein